MSHGATKAKMMDSDNVPVGLFQGPKCMTWYPPVTGPGMVERPMAMCVGRVGMDNLIQVGATLERMTPTEGKETR
jgi:hypothetical protein